MSFIASGLALNSVAPGFNVYYYQNTSDTLATMLGASYFDYGPNTGPRLQAGDLIECYGSDGVMKVQVSATSDTTGAVVVYYKGGDLPIQTWGTALGTAAGLNKMSVGYYEVGTSVCTATRGILPVPYPGAKVFVRKIDSGTATISFDMGASVADFALNASGAATGGGTAVVNGTVAGSVRRINLRMEGEMFCVHGSSTTRWRVVNFSCVGTGKDGSFAGEGASNFFVVTA
jgi:hypothetical protein